MGTYPHDTRASSKPLFVNTQQGNNAIGRIVRERWPLVFLVLIAGLPLFFLNIKHSPGSPLPQLFGFAHLIFFALLAWQLHGIFRSMREPPLQPIFLVMLILIAAGGIIELAQPYFGRGASWRDLGIDILGGVLGIVYLAPPHYRKLRHPIWVGMQIVVIAMVILVFHGPVATLWDMGVALRQFPVLSDFETRMEAKRWSRGVIAKGIARHGTHALEVDLGLEPDKKYHGTTLRRSFGNWRGYTTFAFSLFIPDDHPLTITVSIRDREHFDRGGEYHDRFNRRFDIRPGWNDVAIPIADIQNAPSERKLELDDLSEVVIFTVDPPAPRRMYLDYVRLIE